MAEPFHERNLDGRDTPYGLAHPEGRLKRGIVEDLHPRVERVSTTRELADQIHSVDEMPGEVQQAGDEGSTSTSETPVGYTGAR
jgi:hypothetical protein